MPPVNIISQKPPSSFCSTYIASLDILGNLIHCRVLSLGNILEGIADMIMTLVYVLVKVGHQVDSGSHLYIDVAPVLFQEIWIVWHYPPISCWICYTTMPAVKYVTPVVNLRVLSLWFWILIAAPSPRLATPAVVAMHHEALY